MCNRGGISRRGLHEIERKRTYVVLGGLTLPRKGEAAILIFCSGPAAKRILPKPRFVGEEMNGIGEKVSGQRQHSRSQQAITADRTGAQQSIPEADV